jgi:hypothetical protein
VTSHRSLARSRSPAHGTVDRKRCTGPRTREGKKRSSKNALKHELNVRVSSYPVLQERADAIVARLLPQWEDPELLELAWSLAEAQVDVERAQVVRASLVVQLEQAIADAACEEAGSMAGSLSVAELLRKLEKLDRYTRRTLSKRKFAIREFDQAQREIQKRLDMADEWGSRLKRGRVRPMYLPEGSLASVVFFSLPSSSRP